MEDMDDDVDKIEKHPCRFAVTFVMPDLLTRILRAVPDSIGDRSRACVSESAEQMTKKSDIVVSFRRSSRTTFCAFLRSAKAAIFLASVFEVKIFPLYYE